MFRGHLKCISTTPGSLAYIKIIPKYPLFLMLANLRARAGALVHPPLEREQFRERAPPYPFAAEFNDLLRDT